LGAYANGNKLRTSWDAGCPGHGKGPWDGLAGTIKSTLRWLILDRELNLQNEYDVHREIRDYFGTEMWHSEHEKSKIKQMNVMWLGKAQVYRPVANSVVVNRIVHREYGIGVRALFGFVVAYYNKAGDSSDRGALGVTGLLLQRFSCGCPPCVSLDFVDCVGDDQLLSRTCHFPLKRSLCPLKREDNVGVAAQKKASQQRTKDALEAIAVGDFFAFETGDYRRKKKDGGGSTHAFSIGRVLPQEGEACVVAQRRGSRSGEQQEYRKGNKLVKLQLHDRQEKNPRTFQRADRIYLLNASKSLLKVVAATDLK